VLDALRLVPGAQVEQTGARGGQTSMFIRGGNADFNKVLVDGEPVNDIGGGFDFAQMAVTGVDRVEVLRQTNSVMYGSDALAGVVAITTRRGQTRTPEVTLNADGGNLNTGSAGAGIGGDAHPFLCFFGLATAIFRSTWYPDVVLIANPLCPLPLPVLEATTRYRPLFTPRIVYEPPMLLTVRCLALGLRIFFPLGLASRTVAPLTPEPLASCTTPEMVLVNLAARECFDLDFFGGGELRFGRVTPPSLDLLVCSE
jgi:hypothetical protein